jgi:hypothetical protein
MLANRIRAGSTSPRRETGTEITVAARRVYRAVRQIQGQSKERSLEKLSKKEIDAEIKAARRRQ